MSTAIVGIDVQCSRGCPYVVLSAGLKPRTSGWLELPDDLPPIVRDLRKEFERVAVGIDAPRAALANPREHYWRKRGWRPRGPADSGHGRHCEVVLKALGLANPQWTPMAGKCAGWMEVGFRLFSSLSEGVEAYEVFPSAAYAQLAHSKDAVLSISLGGFVHGPKDMLDAYVAAYTVHEYLEGRGSSVGGGDGLGEIILPMPVVGAPVGLFDWPNPGAERPPNDDMQRTSAAQARGVRR